jgi:YggT family protein
VQLICAGLTVYWVILFIRIILSWVTMAGSPPASLAPAIRIVYELTEPVLGFFRRLIPPLGMFDISPIIVFILLNVLQGVLGCGGLF